MNKNIAVIGCGYWGKNVVRVFNELGVLHTVCDIDEGKSDIFNSFTTDYHHILDNPEIKGVAIATLASTHYEIAQEALLAGKDVLVEKPMALNIEQGVELVEIDDNNKRILLVGHVMEYHPAIVKIKELIDNGELGKLYYLYSTRLSLGIFRTVENVLWSFAPHDISIFLSLIGRMPLSVSCHGNCYISQGIEDVIMTTLNFGDIYTQAFVSWLHPYKEQKLIIVGQNAMIVFDDSINKDYIILYKYSIERDNDNRIIPYKGLTNNIDIPYQEPLKLECQDFIECIEERRKPKVDGVKGLKVLKVLSCCQQSLEHNKEVFLNE